MKPIDIIMTTYNRLALTKQSLYSIIRRTKTPYWLTVIDNFSTDGTREFLQVEKLNGHINTLVLNESNLGLAVALQQGYLLSDSRYFVTVDNDCIAPDLDPDWLSQLVTLMDKNFVYGAIALRPQVLIGVGQIFKTDKEIVDNNVVGGSYRIMRRKAVETVDGWTDRFENDGRGKEEWDICTKLRNAGYKVGYTRNLWTYHQWGSDKWGYDELENYKMGRVMEHAPKDVEYNHKTCEPLIKCNE